MRPFLTADWKNLINLTYKVDPALIRSRIPSELQPDIRDGSAFVSLVAFEFLNTRVKGVKVPFHINFPEINLRTYVNYKGRPGVIFIKEYVPKHCIAFIAKKFYNEPYESFPMEVKNTENDDLLTIEHQLWRDENKFSLKATVLKNLTIPPEGSLDHLFKEHDIGFGVGQDGVPLYYMVEHPVWRSYEFVDFALDIDFGILYGKEWAFLNDAEPFHKLVAEGSMIKVFHSQQLQSLQVDEEDLEVHDPSQKLPIGK